MESFLFAFRSRFFLVAAALSILALENIIFSQAAVLNVGTKRARVSEFSDKLQKYKKIIDQDETDQKEEDRRLALVQKSTKTATATLPPEFWMWKTTPAPPVPPGPYAQVVWVAHTAGPLPTIAPSAEACYGCDCLFAFPDKLIKGGAIADEYTCFNGAASVNVPEIRWAGLPQNSGVGHEITRSNGKGTCPQSMSFAIVMEDMDYPNGIGESTNRIFNQFWAVNIPGNWTSFNAADVGKKYKGQNIVHIGKNGLGKNEMASVCPRKGVHRYRLTVWVLRDHIGSGDEPLPEETTFGEILPRLEELELARVTVYGNVKGRPIP